MNNDAISRSAVLAILTNNIVISEDEIGLMEEVCHTINVAPALDVVPVVRCKDCKHYDAGCWCAELERGTAEDFFCAYGEVKSDD